jgi:hypothetical protein
MNRSSEKRDWGHIESVKGRLLPWRLFCEFEAVGLNPWALHAEASSQENLALGTHISDVLIWRFSFVP